MTASLNDRWRKAGELFDQALELRPEQRGRFLDEQCRDDAELRASVESLLRADDRSQSHPFLSPPVPAMAAGLLSEYADAAFLGELVGKYRLVERVASGGMGTVFRAMVDGDSAARPVAVKLIRRGMDTLDGVRRFKLERETLARLDHPGIAKLLDGGVTERGIPFLVMELIEGQPIDRYCDEWRLNPLARIRLLLSVCAGLEYAHRNLVVHRDIKPNNVLVRADGRTTLLDFGIAKLLDDDPADAATVTLTAFRVITPLYASPEVLRGEPASTAMDVYSLGVLLYELLTGRPPYNLGRRSSYEAQRIICEVDPPAPSDAVLAPPPADRPDGSGSRLSAEALAAQRGMSPRDLSRALRGDLDTIILKSLQKDPNRRYRSVEQFSDDLSRHLAGFPILARKDSSRYRAAKFIRRNRAAVAVALVMVLSVAGGLGGIAFGLFRAREQAARARVQADRAERINSVLGDMLGSIDFEIGNSEITLRRVLDLAAERLEKDSASSPDISAAARQAIGDAYLNLGLYNEAEKHFRQALAVRQSVFGPTDALVAESAAALGKALRIRASFAEAEEMLRLAISINEGNFGPAHSSVAGFRQALGTLFAESGQFRDAEREYRTALKTFRELHETESTENAVAMQELGVVLTFLGRREEGVGLCKEALSLNERLYGRESVPTASSLREYATALQIQGDFVGAEAAYREALATDRKLRGDLTPSVSRSLNNMGSMLSTMNGRRDEGREMLREALRLRRQIFGESHVCVAVTLNNLAATIDDNAETEALLRESLRIARGGYGGHDHRLADALQNLAGILRSQMKFAEAEPMYREALHIYRGLNEKHPKVSYPLLGLGSGFLEQGDAVSAEPLLREAVEIRRALPTPSPALLGAALSAWGEALSLMGREGAEEVLHEAVEELNEAAPTGAETNVARKRLAEHFDRTGQHDRAASVAAPAGGT